MSLHFWENIITPPLAGRTEKPRVSGLTMVIDKGLPLAQTRDWLSLAFPYVDLVKFTFGTPVLYPEEILKPKIDFLRKQGINVFPGGTLLEVAVLQNKTGPFFEFVYQLGFNFLEISDGSITMEKTVRGKLITEGRRQGLGILTEVGKKNPRKKLSPGEMKTQLEFDLEQGADFVIIEGRESGKNAGIYDENGEIDSFDLENLITNVPRQKIIWEAPLKNQQVELIKRFGVNVNLGNIPPGEILALEALRQGLRGDTLVM